MTRYDFVCLLLGPLFVYPMVNSTSALAVQAAAKTEDAAHNLSSKSGTRTATPDEPAITITGLCSSSLDGKPTASNCKTVITQSQFQRIIDAVEPNLKARGR